MTPEGKVKAVVTKLLKSYGTRVYFEMPVPGGYGKSGLDYIGFANGRGFAVETKKNENSEPTDRQKKVIREMKAAGAHVFVIQGRDDPELKLLAGWLNNTVGPPDEHAQAE